jgi:hypothetical protein
VLERDAGAFASKCFSSSRWAVDAFGQHQRRAAKSPMIDVGFIIYFFC